jgi:small subunit ribosomal protein S5e
VNDISLEDYIAVKTKFATFVPHTAGRYQKKRFRKAQCPIAERYSSAPVLDWRKGNEC